MDSRLCYPFTDRLNWGRINYVRFIRAEINYVAAIIMMTTNTIGTLTRAHLADYSIRLLIGQFGFQLDDPDS